MNKKVKALIGSALAIAMSASVATGATFALFTDKAEVNVAITAGRVDVEAEVSNLKLYSVMDATGEKYLGDGVTVFECGGTASLATDSNTLTLQYVTPGDKVTFDLKIENKSNVAIKYRSVLEIKSINGKNLMDVLDINLGEQDAIIDASATRKVSKWKTLLPTDDRTIMELIPVAIELPASVGNDYQDASIEFSYYIEAVQGNATTVDPDEDTIEIATVSDLKAFASSVNAGNTYSNKTVVLTSNLDLNDEAWTAIGATTAFKGIFDGQGHSISGLKAEGDGCVGLFGTLNGTVKNLTVIAPELDGASAGTGAIAGKIFNTGLIDNCTVIDPVIVGEHYAGGIVGYAYGSVTNCTVEGGSIDITTGAPEDGDKVGGIVGYIGEGASYIISGNTVKDIEIVGVRDIGGIAGMAQPKNTVIDNVVDGVVLTAKNTPASKAVNVNHVVGRVASGANVKNNTVNNQQTINIILGEGTYAIGNVLASDKTGVVITGAGDKTVLTATAAANKPILARLDNVTFKDLAMTLSSANYQGFQHAGVMNYENVTFNGSFFLYGEQENFTNCNFNLSTNYLWTYAAKEVNFVGCDFNTAGKAILVYNEGNISDQVVNIKDCNFAASAAGYTSAGELCAAVEVDSSLISGTYTVNFSGTNTVDTEFAGLYRWKKGQDKNNLVVTGANTASSVTYAASKEELKESLEQDVKDIVINLAGDQVIDITAWETLKFGGDSTETITINGNGHTITFNNINNDWSNVTAGNAKLIINDAHLTNSGHNDGTWAQHDIVFNCDVELNNVTSDKALAFEADATLNNVVINDANTTDTYAIWIQTNGQTVNLNNVTIDMLDCTDGRGIAIKDQYVNDVKAVTLNINGLTVKTEEKAAILVTSTAGAIINVTGTIVNEAAADSVNLVWNDSERVDAYDRVTVTGASKVQE